MSLECNTVKDELPCPCLSPWLPPLILLSLPLSAARTGLCSPFPSVFSCAALATSVSRMDSQPFPSMVIWTVGRAGSHMVQIHE